MGAWMLPYLDAVWAFWWHIGFGFWSGFIFATIRCAIRRTYGA